MLPAQKADPCLDLIADLYHRGVLEELEHKKLWLAITTLNDIWAEEAGRMQDWVNDLQSGMYVNCVYCGHRYGPGETTPVSMADALKAHIEQCPKHPMSALKRQVDRMAAIKAVAERMTESQQLATRGWGTRILHLLVGEE
jgi:hypothetical protein